jgi:hypothetical protein
MRKFLLILSAIFTGAIAAEENENQSGGNGEVRHFNSGGNGEVTAQTIENILNKIYGDGKYYARLISDALVALSDRSGGSIRVKDVQQSKFMNRETFVIVLEKPMPSQTPLKSNIKGTEFKDTNGVTIISIPVKNIGDKILITNKNNQKLIEYTIKK